jgi:hypothetical protein
MFNANPYMRLIELVECEMNDVKVASDQKVLDKSSADDYIQNMLEVRDTLSRFRQAELESLTR